MTNQTITVPIGINYAVRLERLIRLSGGTVTARGLIEQALDGMLGRENPRTRSRHRGGRGKGARIKTLFERDPKCGDCGKTTIPDSHIFDDRPKLTRDGQRLICGGCLKQHRFSTVLHRISRGEPAKVESFGDGTN